MKMNNSVEKINNDQMETTNSNWQKFHEFWKIVTTKPETITKSFDKLYQYELSDIEDVHHKIMAISDRYKSSITNYDFTVHYQDKTKRSFNSFETFSVGVGSISSPICSIVLEYNFAIKHEQTDNFGSYKINLNLISKIADNDFLPFPRFLRHLSKTTGYLKIEHVDYVIAQNFVNIIKDWFDGRKVTKESKTIKFLQKYSEHLPLALRELFTAIFAYLMYLNISTYASNDVQNLLKIIIINLTFVVIARSVIHRIGSIIEYRIDSMIQLSYINITKGDKNLIAEFKEKKRSGIKRAAIALIGNIIIGTIATFSASYLSKIISL